MRNIQFIFYFIRVKIFFCSFHRGMVRGKHTIGRAFSLLFLSLILFGAIFLLHFILGYPDHDPILVMRLLRPVVVSQSLSLE